MTGRRSQSRRGNARVVAGAMLALSMISSGLRAHAQERPAVVDVRVGGAPSAPALSAPQAASNAVAKTPQPIQRSAVASSPARVAAAGPSGSSALAPINTYKLLYSLAIVLAVIFALRWVARRIFRLPGAPGQAGPIQVIHRMTLAPKQQLMLIQVGRRVVLVANCGAQMSTLCEMTDPDEISALVAQNRTRVSESPFSAWFGRARGQFPPEAESEPHAPEQVEPNVVATREDVGTLLEKVRLLSRAHRQG